MPIRWMSPEAIQYGHYTTANDIWAFGITMWEVFSYGTIPYSAWSNEDVAENVQAVSLVLCLIHIWRGVGSNPKTQQKTILPRNPYFGFLGFLIYLT